MKVLIQDEGITIQLIMLFMFWGVSMQTKVFTDCDTLCPFYLKIFSKHISFHLFTIPQVQNRVAQKECNTFDH